MSTGWIIFWVIVAIVAIVAIGLFIASKKLMPKYEQQQQMINEAKQTVDIFVVEKKKDKLQNIKLPKQAKEQLPKRASKRTMPMVMGKVGPQFITFICDKKVYDTIPVKKKIKAEVAGILITNVVSGKLPTEPSKKAKKAKEKAKKEAATK